VKIYTPDDVTTMLGAEIAKSGSQSALARECGVAPSYLHDVLHGRRWPGAKIISRLGLTEIRGFVKTPSDAKKGKP